MPTFDMNNIPRVKAEQVLHGLEGEAESISRQICRTVDKDIRKGTHPTKDQKDDVGRSKRDDEASRGVAEGDKLPRNDQDFGSNLDFKCLRYGREEDLRDAQVETVENTTDLTPLEDAVRGAKRDTASDLDQELKSVLTDTNKNETFDVTSVGGGKWSNASSSSPLKDIRKARSKIGGAPDTLCLGDTDVENLQDNEDILAESSNFAAGFAGDGDLANLIRRKFRNFETVIIGDVLFDDANPEGKSFSLNYKLSDTSWMGYRRGLLLFEFTPMSPRMYETQEKRRATTQVGYEERVDIKRTPHKKLGLLFQNQN